MKRTSARGKHVAVCRKEAHMMIKRFGYSGAFRLLFKKIGLLA
jgi:hypothetical protein